MFNTQWSFRINVFLLVLNLGLVAIVAILGLPSVFSYIFLANGFCFVIGALSSWWINQTIKVDSNKNNK